MRGRRLAAAREARTIKDALERAVALDPTLYDARFGIGLYRYYAAVAPAPLRAVRWLLLMPGGDKAGGLRDMTTARERGVLVGGDADYQLHFLYLWYEREPARALELLQHLNARYPSNPLFLQRVAEVQRDYLRDDRASLSTWQTLLDRALSTPGALSAMSAARARRWWTTSLSWCSVRSSRAERSVRCRGRA